MPITKKTCAGGPTLTEITPMNLNLSVIPLTLNQRSTAEMKLAST
jgi:hypothetical protein